MFHCSLLACCLEVVLFSYSSPRTFPWIISIFKLPAFYFFKVHTHTHTHVLTHIYCKSYKDTLCVQVIEVFIRAEEGLSRDMVKHLNSVEEQVLESRAWTASSALWGALQADGNKVPTVEEVGGTSIHSIHHIGHTRYNTLLRRREGAQLGCRASSNQVCVFQVS